jgi:hypothetical protein
MWLVYLIFMTTSSLLARAITISQYMSSNNWMIINNEMLRKEEIIV